MIWCTPESFESVSALLQKYYITTTWFRKSNLQSPQSPTEKKSSNSPFSMLKIKFILGWLPHHTLGNFFDLKLYIEGVISANTDTKYHNTTSLYTNNSVIKKQVSS